jgi:hypothetical protein
MTALDAKTLSVSRQSHWPHLLTLSDDPSRL